LSQANCGRLEMKPKRNKGVSFKVVSIIHAIKFLFQMNIGNNLYMLFILRGERGKVTSSIPYPEMIQTFLACILCAIHQAAPR
jgi:hypothetical protein